MLASLERCVIVWKTNTVSPMTHLYELVRIVAKATDPNDDDVTQLCGCYPTLDEADLAKDCYEARYPGASFVIQ